MCEKHFISRFLDSQNPLTHIPHTCGKSLQHNWLKAFYHWCFENTLTHCLTSWYANYTEAGRESHQYILKYSWTALATIFRTRCLCRTAHILADAAHPCHRFFSLLLSGRRPRAVKAHTSRLKDCFVPRAITVFNLMKLGLPTTQHQQLWLL